VIFIPANIAILVEDWVVEKMREVQSGFSTTQSSTRIAILAGMNITDELFNARQSGDLNNNDAEQKISSLIDLIDDNL
jgi:cell division protein ZapA (FtsZ GTPase activity inhibitor)